MVGSENFEIPFVSSKNPNLTKAIRFVFLRYNSPLIREVTLAGIIYIHNLFVREKISQDSFQATTSFHIVCTYNHTEKGSCSHKN